jgi:hypothetical protein
MRQYFRATNDLLDNLFLKIEVDTNTITIKAFHEEIYDELPENTLSIDNKDGVSFLQDHNIDMDAEFLESVVSGSIFFEPSVQSKYFRYFGGAQIRRAFDQDGNISILTRTTTYDRGFDKNVGFDKNTFVEWSDCALWAFDFNFDGMNWFYPKNILFDSIITKSPFVRHELNSSYVTAPKLIRTTPEGASFWTSGEFRKRLFSIFILDKDDDFTECSYYVRCHGEFHFDFKLGTNEIGGANFAYVFPLLSSYSELPLPKIQLHAPEEISKDDVILVNVSLYDNEENLLTEDTDKITCEHMDSKICLEDLNATDLKISTPNNLTDVHGTISDQYIIQKDIDFYVSANAGYLSKRKCNVKNGRGRFLYRALDLEVGDDVEIKIGFKSFSNISNLKLKVIP